MDVLKYDVKIEFINQSKIVKLYKYHAVNKFSLSALARRKIWVASPKSFNDPYDCDASLLRNAVCTPAIPIGRGGARGFMQPGIIECDISLEQKKWVDEIGVYSLTEHKKNRLMWGHYADHFKGFCMEYTFDNEPPKNLIEVEYPELNRRPAGYWPEDQHEFINEAARYKAEAWHYEDEHRLVFPFHSKYVERPARITGVIFGSHCQIDDKKTILGLLDKDLPRFEIALNSNGTNLETVEDDTEI